MSYRSYILLFLGSVFDCCLGRFRIDSQAGQRTCAPINFRNRFTDSVRAHFPVKALCIWIGLDLNLRHVPVRCALHRMEKQRFPYTRAYVLRRHPQVIQLGFVLPNHQSVETENLVVCLGNKDWIADKVFERDREVILPVLDPMLRITPVALRVVSDLRQSCGFFRYCPAYSHPVLLTLPY